MTRSDGWVQAGADIADLEKKVGGGLPSVSIQVSDQWAAGVRQTFEDLDAALDTSGRARAAFAGAYIAVSLLIDNIPLPWDRLDKAACMLRWLYDRGSEDDVDLQKLFDLPSLPDLEA